MTTLVVTLIGPDRPATGSGRGPRSGMTNRPGTDTVPRCLRRIPAASSCRLRRLPTVSLCLLRLPAHNPPPASGA